MRYKIIIHKSRINICKPVLSVPPRKKILVYLQLMLVCFMLWMRDALGFPSAITYLTDVITVLILFFEFSKIKKGLKNARIKVQARIVWAILICMIFGAMINLVNPLLFLWGFRNSFRFFVFFFICVGLLDAWDVEKIVDFFKAIFFLNVIMITFQYFVQGYQDDFLGGFFGTGSGCNVYVCILLCVITAIVLAEFLNSKMTLMHLLLYCVACMYIATLAELKVYFLEFIIIVGIQMFYTKPTLKTIGICISAVVILIIGFNFIKMYNPGILNILLNKDAMDYYLSGNGYTNSGDLNRLSAVQQVHEMFFEGDLFRSLFGFGLGSCEQSGYDFLTSAFSRQYEYLHYRWFSHAWIYLEQGLIGLILTVLFFVSIALAIIKRFKMKKVYTLAAFSFIPTCIIGLLYNSALELEATYMIALVCAFPFILKKRNNEMAVKRG